MSSVSSLNSLLSSSSTSSTSSLNLSSLLSAATGSTTTGIDVNSAVEAAIYAAQAPERQWQAEQSTIQSQITALTSIQSAGATLRTDLQNLSDPLGAMTARTVSSSNSSAVTATAFAGTQAGTHTVTVSQLATSASWYSPVLSSASASLGSSTLTITQSGGTQTTFDLNSTGNRSLSALVSSINAAKLGIMASVVQDASGVRLALVGTQTGAAADFSVSENSTSSSTWTSATLPQAGATLAASSFVLDDGTSSAVVNVSGGTTLDQLASQINASGLSVTASVVSDTSGSHLAVTGNAGQQVSLSADPALVFTQASHAQNASLSVDGVPVSSASNSVNGALAGVTLTLTGTTPSSPVSLSVSADTSRISSAVSQFVTDYNSLIGQVNTQFTFNTSTGSQGVLGSDATVRSMQSALLSSLGYSQTGSSTSVSSLADLGVTMNDDGTLTLDSTKLNQALSSDPTSVQNFFQSNAQGGFANAMQTTLKGFTLASAGSLAVDIKNLTSQYNNLQSNVNDYESGYITSQKTLLTSMYSKAEIALQSLPATLKQIDAELNGNSGNS